MKRQLSSSNCAANTHLLHHRLSTICVFVTGFVANSIIAISLTSHAGFARQLTSKVESSAVQNLQSHVNSGTRVLHLPASVLGGEIKLDCPTRLNLLQPIDCPTGEGGEPLLNIPKESIRLHPNQNDIVTKSDQLDVLPLFEIRF